MSNVMVRVDEEHDLWLPEWVLQTRAQERAKRLMAMQPEPGTISDDRLYNSGRNDRLKGVYATVKPGATANQSVVLIVPAIGNKGLTAEELRYHVGMYTEGGYGKGPEMGTTSRAEYQTAVGHTVDYIIESRKKAEVNAFSIAT